MENNIIHFNSYKLERGGLLYDMYDQFNARVGDQGTPLVMQWTQGLADTLIDLQAKKLHFYATGQVGQYLEKLKDGTGYQMSADASQVEYEDRNAAGTMDHGITKVKLPKQFFPQEGIFYGYFGLKDDQGNTYTSVNVWFRVLGGVPIMGAAIPYFSTRFDELMETCQGRIEDVLAQLRQEYQDEVKKNQDMSTETRAALSKLADTVGAIQAQIDAGNVITRKEYNDLANKIENTLAKMNLKPETFENEAALRAKYPSGVEGELKVTADTGHKWLYVNGNWKDCGVFQSAGYPEVDEARIGAKHLGAKEYKSLGEALHRQIDGLSNLGNQAFSEEITGTAGQEVSLPSEYEIGLQAGTIIKIKFDLENQSDLSVIQIYADKNWFTSIEQKDFGKWQRFELDKDIGTLGVVIPSEKFTKRFVGKISFQILTKPVLDLQSKMNNLMLYELPVSLSTSKDELLPDGISGLTLDSGSKIFVRLKVDSSEQVVKNYQLTVNGKFFTSFNDNNWHEVKLTNSTTSLGFQAFQASILKDCDGTFQVVGNTLGNVYRDIDSDKEAIDRRFSKLLEESLSISASSDSDDVNTTAVKSLTLPKGSKIRVQFSPEDGSGSVEGYQVYANGKYLISYQDVDTWHEITLPDDTDSLGYAFYKERVHGQLKGNFKIIGGIFNDMYTILSSDDEAGTDALTKNVTTQLLEKEKRINEINDGITNGISFIWMTDPHFPSNDLLSKPSMKHILNHTSIPFVLCGGDYPGAYGTKDDVLVSRDEVLEYQDYIGKGKFFSVQANHDFTIKKSPTDSSGYTAANSLVYNTLIRPNEFYLSSAQSGKEYYYLDVPSQKTRIFMLNSMDGNPKADNSEAWGTQYIISQDQADWLTNKAAEKNGWKFIFICHVPTDSNIDSYHPNEEFFHQIASAINQKRKLDFHNQGLNEGADFTNTKNQVVAIIAGHNHVDQSSAKDGVLSITTTSDAHYTDGGWNRQKDLYSSQAFDVVSVDYDTEQIITTRIGAGEDRSFNYGSTDQGEQINSLKLQQIPNLAVNGTAKCTVTMSTPLVAQAITWSNNCFKWTTSDSSIAEVDNSGVVTAHKSGTVTITAATRDGRHSDYCDVTVK